MMHQPFKKLITNSDLYSQGAVIEKYLENSINLLIGELEVFQILMYLRLKNHLKTKHSFRILTNIWKTGDWKVQKENYQQI